MNTFNLIRDWAQERGLYEKGNPHTQYVKLQEEAGELAKALLKNDEPEIIDAIGDIAVVLTNLAHLKGYKIEDCINSAYDVIKNRKGEMKGGTFVKQEDNKKEIKYARLHPAGYYNLPCRWSEIPKYLEKYDIMVGDRIFTSTDEVRLDALASASLNGGVAYIRLE
jgi:NTP pyrophosphatase (non-canonical NTP hydrolase)